MIRELVKPEHQLFHHPITSCSYNLDRNFLSKTLIENMIHYNDVDRKTHKVKLQGVASRVFQHEYDHMEGIDFTQRS